MRRDTLGELEMMRRAADLKKPILAAAAAAALLALTACGGGHEPRRRAEGSAVPAPVATAQAASWPSALEVTASVNPFRRAAPGTILMGRVDQVLHREGDRVGAGAALARVESREVEARLAQAEANVAAARAMEENARLMKERMERLFEKQAATQKNVDDARAGYEAAAAGLRAAEEGVLAARMYVAYADVAAPFAGVVVEKRVEVGDTAAPGMPLFVVEDTSRMKVEAQVPESALRDIAAGSPVEVVVDAAGVASRAGTLAEVLPAADPRSRTFTVRVVLDNADGALRSGMFARLRLPGEEKDRIAVAEDALVRRGPLTGVFVVDEGGIARLRWITTGETRDRRIEVLTGLAEGERFVTAPPAGLEDGRRVEVR